MSHGGDDTGVYLVLDYALRSSLARVHSHTPCAILCSMTRVPHPSVPQHLQNFQPRGRVDGCAENETRCAEDIVLVVMEPRDAPSGRCESSRLKRFASDQISCPHSRGPPFADGHVVCHGVGRGFGICGNIHDSGIIEQ